MRQPVDAARVHEFMRAFGREAGGEVRVYLTGGATAVLEGWRATTADIDLKIVPDSDKALQSIPDLKEKLRINVEPRLFRYPAIDPKSFRRAVEEAVSAQKQ